MQYIVLERRGERDLRFHGEVIHAVRDRPESENYTELKLFITDKGNYVFYQEDNASNFAEKDTVVIVAPNAQQLVGKLRNEELEINVVYKDLLRKAAESRTDIADILYETI